MPQIIKGSFHTKPTNDLSLILADFFMKRGIWLKLMIWIDWNELDVFSKQHTIFLYKYSPIP